MFFFRTARKRPLALPLLSLVIRFAPRLRESPRLLWFGIVNAVCLLLIVAVSQAVHASEDAGAKPNTA